MVFGLKNTKKCDPAIHLIFRRPLAVSWRKWNASHWKNSSSSWLVLWPFLDHGLPRRKCLVEVDSEAQAEMLLIASVFGFSPCDVLKTPISELFRVQHYRWLPGWNIDEIQSCLANRCVSKTFRLIDKKDGKLFHLQTFFQYLIFLFNPAL